MNFDNHPEVTITQFDTEYQFTIELQLQFR
jgi:hypothetical protein